MYKVLDYKFFPGPGRVAMTLPKSYQILDFTGPNERGMMTAHILVDVRAPLAETEFNIFGSGDEIPGELVRFKDFLGVLRLGLGYQFESFIFGKKADGAFAGPSSLRL